ncbi:MAG TPA: ABC transporter permease [Bacteroidota bacterium]|jgi:ABC-2 type transport system permease protein|nr:ABC transporter permease [Bacteroidota bacterium]
MTKSLHIIFEIIRKEFYQIRQDKRMLMTSFLAPLMQVFLLGYAATTDIKYSTMVVCDLDRTQVSREFISKFTNSNYFVEGYNVPDPREIDFHIEHSEASVALVIPPSFGELIAKHQTARVQMILDGSDANTATILLGYATQIVNQYAESVVIQSLPARRMPDGRVIPEPRVWFNPDLKSSNYMVPGVVAFVLMIITMTLTSLGIVKEKEVGTLEQLLVTPIKPYQLIAGKLIPFIIIGFIDVMGVLAIAHYWFEVPLRGHLLTLFFLSGLFILTTLGLGLFISTIARTQQQAMLIAQFFFFMPFIYLSGFAFPIANMPQVIQYVTYVIPLRYFLEIVRGVFLKGSGFAELWTQAVVLFAFGVVILTLSVLRFRRRLG